ncbi:MAG: PAS domain S-box protein [Candidatus Methylomirabilia bacterium]
MKFATKLLLALSGGVIASMAALIPTAGIRTSRLFEGQLVGRLEDNAHHMLTNLDQYFYERILETKTLMADPAFSAAAVSPEQTTRFLREFLRWEREYVSAAFYTMDWVVVADTAGRQAGEHGALEDCRADLAAGKDVAVCVERSSPGESPTIRLAVVARDDRATHGVLVMRLPIQVLGDQLREVPGRGGSAGDLHIDLVDKEGTFLYSNYHQEGIPHETSPDRAFLHEKIRAGPASGSLTYTNPAENTGEEILVYVRERGFRDYPGSGWTLNLFVPTETVFLPLRLLRLGNIAVVLVADFTLLVILFLLVRAFTRPIEELGRAAREIGKGNLEVRVPVGSRDELGLFAETFNQMAASMEESQRALSVINRELEGKVAERTGELLHMNEELHAELSERVKAQEALQVRERLLRLNADIGEALTLGEALPEVLQRCAGIIVRDLDAAFVRIWMLGDEAGVLELKASAGIYTRLDGQHNRKIVGTGKIGIIAQDQRPILTNAVLSDPAIADHEWARQEGMVAFAGHPLVVDGKTVGVMALFSRRPLESFVLSALENVAQRIAAFIGRQRAEEALRASENRYRELFDAASDGIYKTDARGVFTSMNRAGARIFGHESPEEVIGRPALEYWRDPKDRERLRADLEREKSVTSWGIAARKKNGEFLELETSSRILEGDDGAFLGIEGVLRDVTQRVKAEAERELILAQLQEAAANVKTLSGLLPICAGCKKIRDDQGSWSQVETYIRKHSEAKFTHGLCPDCQKVYFPGSGGKF